LRRKMLIDRKEKKEGKKKEELGDRREELGDKKQELGDRKQELGEEREKTEKEEKKEKAETEKQEREVPKKKEKWEKPQLIVLVRGKPEESILNACKNHQVSGEGPDITYQGCEAEVSCDPPCDASAAS
ncbi:MAG: hypothetical protein KAS87_03815, partial [Candidatus Omnitrophica bacterium]|nr:hypothetical protein [Candidatus Omnitrophota bacterium]